MRAEYDIDFRERPECYEVGRGEDGAEPERWADADKREAALIFKAKWDAARVDATYQRQRTSTTRSLRRLPMTAFDLDHARALLARTPATLDALLRDLPEPFVHADEGPRTWSPFDVVGHLIHGERTDWLVRARLILRPGGPHPFEPFDRFAQEEASRGQALDDLLDAFAALRAENLHGLDALALTDADLDREGRHPDFGPVTLRQLLASWVVHDLGHLAQITRAMAKGYRDEVGPWRAYLRVLDRR